MIVLVKHIKQRIKMSIYANRSYDKKNIVVFPTEKIQYGVSAKPGKKPNGWLRVGAGNDARFYSLPIQDGQLHESVQRIVDSIIKQQTNGETARFFWHKIKNEVRWIDVAAETRAEKELYEMLDNDLI